MLEKMHYEIAGERGAVQICMWNKEALLDKDFCYKQKFYGIRSHLCCQMTPIVDVCDQRCLFCWRPWEIAFDEKSKGWDEPAKLVDDCIIAQRRKLSGFGGNDKVNTEKLKMAQEPMHFAISLAGEPTLYPHLAGLIKELHARDKTTFLVTNGQHPEVLKTLEKEGALPTQLYVSLDAPTKEIYEKLDQPLNKDGWARLIKTLGLLASLPCRRVIRLTLIRDWNLGFVKEWAKRIRLAEGRCKGLFRSAFGPLMIECKAYMHVGYSRKRLKKENMPLHSEIREFSEALAKELGWKILDEQVRSRVVLLAREDFDGRVMCFE
jgi:tRNA wybutosine-synthesizing protein 1